METDFPSIYRSGLENNRTIVTGYLLAVVSAIAYSAKGIFAKLIYGYGVDPLTLLALRFVIALPFFWLTLIFYPSAKLRPRDGFYLVLSGLTGLYAAAIADFYGLLYIDASLERTILYTYPAIVVLWAAVFFNEKLVVKKIAAMAVTYLGLALAVKLFGGGLKAHYLGVALVLFSAVIYSLSYIITEVLGRRVSAVKISAYSTTAACFAFLGTWHGRSVPHEPGVWGLLVVLAVFSTYVPVLALVLSIKRIGASRAALISFIGPVSTAVLANIVLGETMDIAQIAGMCLVITGVIALSYDKRVRAQTRA